MKKRLVKAIALVMSVILLASCNSALSASVNSEGNAEKMLGFNRNSTSYSSNLDENEILTYYSCIVSDGETMLETPVVVNIKIPSEWEKAENNVFQSFNVEKDNTILCMKAPYIYRIPTDFVLNENVHASLNVKGVRADLEGWKSCVYKTESQKD